MGTILFGSGFFRSSLGGGYSEAAEAVFAVYDSIGDGLTDAEKAAMAIYIDAEIASANQSKKDSEAIFSLSGNNGLVDYVGGVLMTAVNSPTHSLNGYGTDGATNYINSRFNPSTDAVNSSMDDMTVSLFLKAVTYKNLSTLVGGANSGNGNSGTTIRDSSASIYYGVDESAFTSGGSQKFTANSLYSASRLSGTKTLYKDGSSVHSTSANADAQANVDLWIGAMNLNGSSFFRGLQGTVSSFMLAQANGFNHSGYNTNLRTLLTSLGLTL